MGRAPIATFKRATARRLRANATGAEVLLWRYLRRIDIPGTHFRRQVPIGAYVADFGCLASKLLIEIDGSQHGAAANQAKDAHRTHWLESEGYRVLRFWNNDLTHNMDGVMDTIYAAVYGSREAAPVTRTHLRRKRSHPTPARSARRPSPSRGG